MPASAKTSILHVSAEQRYLAWINKQLAALGKHVDDVTDSLADGILIIQALEVHTRDTYTCTVNAE